MHLTPEDEFAAHWSITRYEDILAIDTNHADFSSVGGITLPPSEQALQRMIAEGGGPSTQGPFTSDNPNGRLPMFVAMDSPKHDVQRKAVSPAVSPASLANMETLIRERAAKILDELPIGEEFDWVDRVSMELTAMTLATLFGMPQEDRRKLTRWSDVVMARPGHGVASWEEKQAEMMAYGSYFLNLWNERVNSAPDSDLISMLAHSPATRSMNQIEYLGNVVLLTIGGNDTTRNTISGSVLALNQYPDQYRKLRENPELVPSMMSETIRWYTPWRTCAARRLGMSNFAAKRSGRANWWRCGTSRAIGTRPSSTGRTTSSSIVRVLESTSRLVSESIAASATGWPNCSSGSSGRRSSTASPRFRSSANRAASVPAS